MRKFSFTLIVLLSITKAFSQYTDEINSKRPGNAMSAFSVGKNVMQLEAGGFGIAEKDSDIDSKAIGFGADVSLRFGFLRERLEGILDLQYQKKNYTIAGINSEVAGLRKALFGFKYLLYDPNKYYVKETSIYSWKANHQYDWHKWVPTLSFYAGTNISLKDDPFFYTTKFSAAPKVMFITQNDFVSDESYWVLVTNVVADRLMTDYASYGYIIAVTRGINERISVFGENEMMFGSNYHDYNVKLGGAYLITRNFQVDASICSSLDASPYVAYGGLGVSWRYDRMHIPEKLLSPTQAKQMKIAQKNAKKKRKLEKKNSKQIKSKNKGFNKVKAKRAKMQKDDDGE